MKQFGLAIILLLYSLNTDAQSVDLGSWNVLNVKYNHTDKLSFFGEGQLRSLMFYDHFHYHELKGGFNCKIQKSAKLV